MVHPVHGCKHWSASCRAGMQAWTQASERGACVCWQSCIAALLHWCIGAGRVFLANFSAVEKSRLHCLCPCPCVFIRSTPLSCGAIAGFFHGRLSCRCAIRLVLQSSPSQPRVCLGQNLQPWLWPVLYQKGCCLAGPSAPFFEAALSCFPGAGFWKDPMATLCCLVAKTAATAACIQPDRWHMVDLFGCKSLHYKMPGTNFSLLFFCLKHRDRSRTCSIFCLQKMQTVAG